jgi:glucosamine--fructose-6-phosphate aminotransferase (isomerizing)
VADDQNPYIADILAQPAALRATIAALAEPRREARELAAGFRTGQSSRLVLTGVGASYAALNYLLFRLTPHGHMPLLVDTGELITDASAVINDGTLLVVVSQSGRTAEIVKLLVAVRGRPIIAITNDPDSPLAKAATVAYVTRAGAEHSVPCKTYVSTLAALALFADDFPARPRDADAAALARAADAMEAWLADWEAKANDIAYRLHGAKSLVVCGRGWSLCSAHAGAMTLREAARIHAEGMSGAQFRHGHMEMIRSGAAVLLFRGSDSTAPLQEKLAEEIRGKGGVVTVVSNREGEGIVVVPYEEQGVMPLMEILVAQLASVGLSWRHGMEPGVFTAHPKVLEGQ